ncbi:hypothetical protein P5P86_14625 [Nocardioides sp. BP30]|nr:hypothetical protein [Nocardioides sp. BP30]WGL51191.1 hypothetical protein P5P86_14625 [Nocardioides sp. BP30]
MSSTVLRLAAEAGEHHEKVNHWIIGLIALVILFGAMGALLIFGSGREHS